MLVKSVLSAGLAATAAQAFLIVPIDDADNALAELVPFDAPVSAEQQSIDVACPGCPVEIPAAAAAAADISNHLEVTFSIDRSPHGDSLLANGFELYPNPDPFSSSLVAPQVVDVADMSEKAHVSMRPLGYRLHVYPVARENEGQHLELIGVDLQIIEIGETFVDGIPGVKVQLVKNGDRLAIATVETVEPVTEAESQCTTLLCKWRAFITQKLATLKRPCHGNMGQGFHGMPHAMPPHGGPPRLDHHPAMLPPQGVPGGHPHHPGPFHHGPPPPHHGLARVFFSLLTHILLPILIGVIAGITASLIGMVFVTITMRVYNFVRGRKASEQPPSYKADSNEAVLADEEKAGLMDEQEDFEAPPSYSDETPAVKL
jgi:hypothetical protein